MHSRIALVGRRLSIHAQSIPKTHPLQSRTLPCTAHFPYRASCLRAASAHAGAEASMDQPVVLQAYASDEPTRDALTDCLQQPDFPSSVKILWPSQPHSNAPEGPTFEGDLYMQHLSSQGALGKALLTAQEIQSTQDFMRAHHSQLPEGTVLTAERQVSGKGRGGNQWTSPAGCLMFTAHRPLAIPGDKAPFINYVICLGVLRGIRDAVQRTCPGLNLDSVRIKWPNDIYYVPPHQSPPTKQRPTPTSAPDTAAVTPPAAAAAATENGSVTQSSTSVTPSSTSATPSRTQGALKIGGVLIHTTYSRGRFNVLVGIGLNVANRQPTTCLDAIVSEALERQGDKGQGQGKGEQGEGGVSLRKEVVLARVISHLDECFQVFESQGFAPLESDYLSSWLHTGQTVKFKAGDSQSVDAIVSPTSSSAPPANIHTHNSNAPSSQQAAASSTGTGTHTADSHAQESSDSVENGGASVGNDTLVTLRIQGVSPAGFLLAVEEGTGRAYELTPDGNSLDMLAGLLRRKLDL